MKVKLIQVLFIITAILVAGTASIKWG